MSLEDVLDNKDIVRLELAQKLREDYISAIAKDGMPETKDDQNFFIKLLDGMDRAVLAKSKIKIEEKNSRTAEESTKLIADVLSKHRASTGVARNNTPVLPDTIVVTDVVDGELDQGISELTYDEFMKSVPDS